MLQFLVHSCMIEVEEIKIYLNILSNMFQHLKNHSATLPAS